MEHVHDWRPPESTMNYGPGVGIIGHYRPEDINMRVCECGEIGWLV